MLVGNYPKAFSKTLFVLGMTMMSVAGALEQFADEEAVESFQAPAAKMCQSIDHKVEMELDIEHHG